MPKRQTVIVGTDAAVDRGRRAGTEADVPGGKVVSAVGVEMGTGVDRQGTGAVELDGITAVGAIQDLGLEHGVGIDGDKAVCRYGAAICFSMDPVSGVVVEGDAGGSGDFDTAEGGLDDDVTVVGVLAIFVGSGLGDCQKFRVADEREIEVCGSPKVARI